MRIAVFLDVDKTLTRNYIQHEYAKILRCDDAYRVVESEFQKRQIDSAEFGRRIIKLFAAQRFTEEKARKHFDDVELQEWTHELLTFSSIDTYLVSSGPNYYIDRLAEKYRIPEQRVLRSEYRFNPKTELIESCKAIDTQDKQEFVKGKVGQYDLTLGVGDSPQFDAFVSHCTIRLMIVQADGYFYAPDFKTVVRLISRLSEIALPEGIAQLDADNLTISQLLKWAGGLTRKSWALLLGSAAVVFSAGAACNKYWPFLIGWLNSKK